MWSCAAKGSKNNHSLIKRYGPKRGTISNTLPIASLIQYNASTVHLMYSPSHVSYLSCWIFLVYKGIWAKLCRPIKQESVRNIANSEGSTGSKRHGWSLFLAVSYTAPSFDICGWNPGYYCMTMIIFLWLQSNSKQIDRKFYNTSMQL